MGDTRVMASAAHATVSGLDMPRDAEWRGLRSARLYWDGDEGRSRSAMPRVNQRGIARKPSKALFIRHMGVTRTGISHRLYLGSLVSVVDR